MLYLCFVEVARVKLNTLQGVTFDLWIGDGSLQNNVQKTMRFNEVAAMLREHFKDVGRDVIAVKNIRAHFYAAEGTETSKPGPVVFEHINLKITHG